MYEDHLLEEKDMLVECINALIIEWDWLLDKLFKEGNILQEINDKMLAFEYRHLLGENVQLLTQGTREKDVTLSSA